MKTNFLMTGVLPLAVILGLLTLPGCQNTTNNSDIEQMKADIQTLKNEYQDLSNKVNNGNTNNTSNTTAQATIAATPVMFDDLNNVPNRHFIEDMANLGLFTGMGKDFKPLQPVTRGEYVTWLFKAYNILNPTAPIQLAPAFKPPLKDLSSSDPAYPYVQALANAGYSVGYDDGKFKSSKPITREEMIAMKVGVDLNKKIAPDPGAMENTFHFADGKDVDKRYTGYINADSGTVGKYGNNINRAFGAVKLFKPKQPVLRYEAVATFWQFGCCPGLGSPTADQQLSAEHIDPSTN